MGYYIRKTNGCDSSSSFFILESHSFLGENRCLSSWQIEVGRKPKFVSKVAEEKKRTVSDRVVPIGSITIKAQTHFKFNGIRKKKENNHIECIYTATLIFLHIPYVNRTCI